jgi:hypothetical protein
LFCRQHKSSHVDVSLCLHFWFSAVCI